MFLDGGARSLLADLDFGDQGEALMTKDYKNWPANLPLLVVHGTADKVSELQSLLCITP